MVERDMSGKLSGEPVEVKGQRLGFVLTEPQQQFPLSDIFPSEEEAKQRSFRPVQVFFRTEDGDMWSILGGSLRSAKKIAEGDPYYSGTPMLPKDFRSHSLKVSEPFKIDETVTPPIKEVVVVSNARFDQVDLQRVTEGKKSTLLDEWYSNIDGLNRKKERSTTRAF